MSTAVYRRLAERLISFSRGISPRLPETVPLPSGMSMAGFAMMSVDYISLGLRLIKSPRLGVSEFFVSLRAEQGYGYLFQGACPVSVNATPLKSA